MTKTQKRNFAGIILTLVIVASYITWQFLSAQRSTVTMRSPDAAYIANVDSTFGLTRNKYNIKVRDSHGDLIRHLVVIDKLPGWSTDPSIAWSADSKTVTIGLEDPDAGIAIKRIDILVP